MRFNLQRVTLAESDRVQLAIPASGSARSPLKWTAGVSIVVHRRADYE